VSDFRIVPRKESGLKAPKRSLTPMRLPVSEVWVHHSVTVPTADPFADWRKIQDIAFGRGYIDISYSIGIHQQGTILEGRGDNVGAHTLGHNDRSYGVVLIGNYQGTQPTLQQIVAMQWLMWHLKSKGKVTPGTFPTGGHRDLDATACPGAYAYLKIPEMQLAWAPAVPAPEVKEGALIVNRPPVKLLMHEAWGKAYALVTDDGGVFSFGQAPFFGSLGGVVLNKPIIDAEPTPSGQGYLMLASDGGIFAFGDAVFHGGVSYTAPRLAALSSRLRAGRRKLRKARVGGEYIPAHFTSGDPGDLLTIKEMQEEELSDPDDKD
jgi:glyoxylase-like metal-dependent hydrolase (beta-lactamase superfamily II)